MLRGRRDVRPGHRGGLALRDGPPDAGASSPGWDAGHRARPGRPDAAPPQDRPRPGPCDPCRNRRRGCSRAGARGSGGPCRGCRRGCCPDADPEPGARPCHPTRARRCRPRRQQRSRGHRGLRRGRGGRGDGCRRGCRGDGCRTVGRCRGRRRSRCGRCLRRGRDGCARLRGRRLGGGPPRGRAPRWLGCRGLGREGLTQLALDRGLDRRGRRLHILTVRVEPRHGVLAGNPQLLGQCADPDLRHFSPRLGPSPWCLSGHGPLVAGGHAHSSELIECSFPFRSSTVEVRSVVVCRSCLDPLADSRGVERSRDPQGPWERPAPLRQIQAADGRMQVRTTTGLPGPGIREAQAVPGGDPKQFGLDCPYPTGDARSRRLAVRSRRIRV